MTTIRQATAEDEPALVELWNAAMGPEFPLTERLLRQTLRADPYHEAEGSLVATSEGGVVGWVLCKTMAHAGPEIGRFRRKGGIGSLCVHPNFRRRGIGTALADRAEAHLRRRGSPLSLLYFPHHLLPGVPAECLETVAFFKGRGYDGWHECYDLWSDLPDYVVPEQVHQALRANPEAEVRPARADEADAVMEMVAREFPGGWTYSTKRHFDSGGAAGDIVILIESGEVLGFCHIANWTAPWLLPNTYWHPLLGNNYGGLGPVGVAAVHRKRGLGLALTALAVQELKQRGVGRMCIDWTTLLDFYGKLGFTVWKRYLQATGPA